MTGTLQLLAYDPAWPARFAAEAVRLSAALGGTITALEHVGSTAVPGLAGKPVLDLAIAVASERAADACIEPIEALGYEYRGPYGDDPRRRYYVRDVDGRRAAQIHLYVLPAVAWQEKLSFRDALRAHPALARAYAAEKWRVAHAVAWDKSAYSTAKGPFVEAVLARLRAGGQLALALSAPPPHGERPFQRSHSELDTSMRPRLTVLTLGVADLERSLAFYRDGLGWPTNGIVGREFEHGAVAFFDLQPGLRLALWPRTSIAHDTGLAMTPPSATDLTLGHNVRSRREVDAALARAARAGAAIVKPAADTFWGGYAGYFQDPDGHVWEVVWNPQWATED